MILRGRPLAFRASLVLGASRPVSCPVGLEEKGLGPRIGHPRRPDPIE